MINSLIRTILHKPLLYWGALIPPGYYPITSTRTCAITDACPLAVAQYKSNSMELGFPALLTHYICNQLPGYSRLQPT